MMTDTVFQKADIKAGSTMLPVVFRFNWQLTPYVFMLLLMVVGSVNATEACTESPELMGVRYQQTVVDLKKKTTKIRHMELWRDGNRVLYVYPDQGLAEQWERSGHGRLHLTTWFDKDKQGIEYMPEDLGKRAGPKHWAEKWQIIADPAVQAISIEATRGEGCSLTQVRVMSSPKRQVSLDWNVALKLPMRYSVKTQDRHEIWQLEEVVTAADRVKLVFNQRAAYKTTDYIDIGDNESDPFLRKLIHLGFVSHGASGFYDAEGHELKSGHSH